MILLEENGDLSQEKRTFTFDLLIICILHFFSDEKIDRNSIKSFPLNSRKIGQHALFPDLYTNCALSTLEKQIISNKMSLGIASFEFRLPSKLTQNFRLKLQLGRTLTSAPFKTNCNSSERYGILQILKNCDSPRIKRSRRNYRLSAAQYGDFLTAYLFEFPPLGILWKLYFKSTTFPSNLSF